MILLSVMSSFQNEYQARTDSVFHFWHTKKFLVSYFDLDL